MKKLTVVGMGPGEYESMTLRAVKALNTCDVIVGYTVYVDLAKPYFPDKEFLTTPMKREIERCEMAFAEAEKGRSVVMICSGDAGIYGMAGPILELGEKHPEVEIEVIPGITAALSGGAVLGAPLMHDFAVISLSDLLTPWELIEKRVRAAAEADFVLAIYNPKSTRRTQQIEKVREIVLQHRPAETPVGVVRSVTRVDEEVSITTLDRFTEEKIDMFTTVIIGNTQTFRNGSFMITPRGYAL